MREIFKTLLIRLALICALVVCLGYCAAYGQGRKNKSLKQLEVQVGDSTYQLDSVAFLNPRGKMIIGNHRERHNARLYRNRRGNGYFVIHNNTGAITGQTDSSEIDGGKRKKRRRQIIQNEVFTEPNAPEMLPNATLPGNPMEPEMGELVSSNDGFAEIDVIVSYKAYINSKLTPEQYVTQFNLRFAQVCQMHLNGGNRIRLRNIKVNIQPDNYTNPGANARMSQLRLDYPNHTAHNLMMVDDEPGNGGVAWLNTVCNGLFSTYRYSYCSIKLGTAPFGTYSYDTYCMAHELGHAFGLNHAFWCGWDLLNGSKGALDSTFTAESFNGVKCFTSTKGSKLGELMGYLQLWGTPNNPHFDVVTSRKLTTNYQSALSSGCITGPAPPAPVAQNGVPGPVLHSIRSGKSWFSFPIATDAKDWVYKVEYCRYDGKMNPPDSATLPNACSIRNGLNFTAPTSAQYTAGKIELQAIDQPATRSRWYKIRVTYRKGSGASQTKESAWFWW